MAVIHSRRADSSPTRRRSAALAWLGLGSLGALGGGACATSAVGTVDPNLEMPSFRVLEAEGPMEVRRYEPHIVAETTTEGEYDEAARDAFRRLASYIFGNNDADARVAMTAPVTSSPEAPAGGGSAARGRGHSDRDSRRDGVRIAMTAPVATSPAEAVGAAPGTGAGGGSLGALGAPGVWTTRFMMPGRYTLATLPAPRDPRVTFREEPARCMGAIAFSGFTTEARVAAMREALSAWLVARGHTLAAGESLARYNDPFTLPWNRRNEVLLELGACADGAPGTSPG